MDPLAPIFAASLAVQQVLEAISMAVEDRFGESRKKPILGVVGFVIGLAMAYGFNLNVMAYFQVANSGGFFDKIVTALILSAGTEGMNSLVKFLKYLKEEKKATAAETVQTVRRQAAEASAAAGLSDAERALVALRRAAGIAAPPQPAAAAAAPENGAGTSALAFISGK